MLVGDSNSQFLFLSFLSSSPTETYILWLWFFTRFNSLTYPLLSHSYSLPFAFLLWITSTCAATSKHLWPIENLIFTTHIPSMCMIDHEPLSAIYIMTSNNNAIFFFCKSNYRTIVFKKIHNHCWNCNKIIVGSNYSIPFGTVVTGWVWKIDMKFVFRDLIMHGFMW